VYRVLEGKPEGKRLLGRLRRIWEDDIDRGSREQSLKPYFRRSLWFIPVKKCFCSLIYNLLFIIGFLNFCDNVRNMNIVITSKSIHSV
jgi:hypothetical protein